MKIIKECLVCKKIFKSYFYKEKPSIFCSLQCYGLSRKLPKRKCKYCKKLYKPKHSYNKFCSVKCFGLSERKEKNPAFYVNKNKIQRITKQCKICNKKYKIPLCREKITKFCSNKCRGTFHSLYFKDKNGIYKKRYIIKNCLICRKNFKFSLFKNRKYCSLKCAQKSEIISKIMSDKNKGVNNPNWKGGISRRPYSFDFNLELKELIRKRDDYKCQLCGAPEAEYFRKLDIHHIDYNKENSNPINLITLCVYCNSKVNFNRSYWQQKFIHKQALKLGVKLVKGRIK